MMRSSRIRWGDNDHFLGPFTYSRDTRGFRPLAVILGSGDDDDYPGCRIRLSGFGHTLIAAIPAIIKPWRRKIYPSSWDAATVERLGRNWYYDTHEREYGFSYSEGFLQVFFGRQTHDSSLDQNWCTHLPWTQWRHVRHSLYGLAGDHYWTQDQEPKGFIFSSYEAMRQMQETCPFVRFDFTDFDGEKLTATTRIEEREWRFGAGWFKWLSWFRRPKIVRALDIEFSGETGKRKGSWKGGTLGHAINMLPGELHRAAFRRYCVENRMTFIEEAPHA